jgi:Protein of unknown function (DUF2799)
VIYARLWVAPGTNVVRLQSIGDAVMATRVAIFACAALTFSALSGCATRADVACIGDPEALGYREGSLGQHNCATDLSSEARIAYDRGWGEGMARFCTKDNGYQQGCQGAPISNVCPNGRASAYLDGYQSGHAIYLMQLEIDAMERSIAEKSDVLEDIWSELDIVSENLEENEVSAVQRNRWIEQARALTKRQDELTAEIDELEADVSARKAELTQRRQAIAIND